MAFAFNGDKSKADLLELVYPIGSIYMSVNNVNPGTLFGGTWAAWGAGRVPVGVNADDDNFNTVEKTGGAATHTLTAAQMPGHTHTYNAPKTPTGSTALTTGSATVSASGNANFMTENDATKLKVFSENLSSALNKLKAATGVSFTNPSFTWGGGTHAITGISGGTHTHSVNGHTHSVSTESKNSGSNGSGNAHNNLQPYITCYMWKRTA